MKTVLFLILPFLSIVSKLQAASDGDGERIPYGVVTLFQSSPNPADDKCLIRFYIPESDPTASIKILNSDSTFNRDISLLGLTGINSTWLSVSDMKDGDYIYQLFYKGELRQSRTLSVKHY